MFPFNRFPYTDFNKINLDWIFEELRRITSRFDEAKESATQAASSATQAASSASQFNVVSHQITLIDSISFNIEQASVYKMGRLIFGTVILRCVADRTSTSNPLISLGTSIPAYTYSIAAASSSQWDGKATTTHRAYFSTTGTVSINSSFSSGQYLTIPIMVAASAQL